MTSPAEPAVAGRMGYGRMMQMLRSQNHRLALDIAGNP
jgi:hypothetical protein